MIMKVSLGFARLQDAELDNFAQSIIDAMTGNAAYPAPPVTMANLHTAKDDLIAKIASARTGGPTDTAAKNNSRQALLGTLRQLAGYVQINCNNDTAVLLSSGFQAQSTNRAQSQLDQPTSLVVKNGVSGQLVASVNPVKNTSMYEGRIKGRPAIGWRACSPATRSTSPSMD